MFGYIKPFSPELKVSQYELYKAAYCGLCKVSGKRISFFSRFFLSYDFVYFTLLRLCLTDEKFGLCRCRCEFCPCKKKNCMKENNALILSGAAFSLLTYYKIMDNVNDIKGFARFLWILLSKLFLPFKKRAERLCEGVSEIIGKSMTKLSEVEQHRESTIDTASSVFGEMLSELLAYNLTDTKARIAKEIGFQTGRFIYICDAADDIYHDVKSKSFNPFINSYNEPDIAITELRKIKPVLLKGMISVSASMELLRNDENSSMIDILQNIAYLGSQKTLDQILEGKNDRPV